MILRFKLDENLPRDAATLLRNAGHDVHDAIEENLGGSADRKVMDVCRAENRILITLDLDFSDIRLYPSGEHKGIWVLRPHVQSISSTLSLLESALRVIDTEPAKDQLWIVEPGQVRVRG